MPLVAARPSGGTAACHPVLPAALAETLPSRPDNFIAASAALQAFPAAILVPSPAWLAARAHNTAHTAQTSRMVLRRCLARANLHAEPCFARAEVRWTAPRQNPFSFHWTVSKAVVSFDQGGLRPVQLPAPQLALSKQQRLSAQ